MTSSPSPAPRFAFTLVGEGLVDLQLTEERLRSDELGERVLAGCEPGECGSQVERGDEFGLRRPALASGYIGTTVALDVADGAGAHSGELFELLLGKLRAVTGCAQLVLGGHKLLL